VTDCKINDSSKWIIRIDDRYIHGQVCLGWCEELGIRKIILCDDQIAKSDFEQDLYKCGIGEEQELRFLSAADLAIELAGPPVETTMVVMGSPETARDLSRAGAPLPAIKIGGLHHRTGSRQLLDYVYLTSETETILRELLDSGVTIHCQNLPSSAAVDLRTLL
jgi:mannose/fructose/N-acetylgalactosamine-specific phosphotransferase system component IIB